MIIQNKHVEFFLIGMFVFTFISCFVPVKIVSLKLSVHMFAITVKSQIPNTTPYMSGVKNFVVKYFIVGNLCL